MQEITLLGMHWWTVLHCCCCCCAFCRLTDRAGRATGLPAALSPPLIVWHWHTMTSNDADDICLSASIWIWICRVSVKGMGGECCGARFTCLLSLVPSPQRAYTHRRTSIREGNRECRQTETETATATGKDTETMAWLGIYLATVNGIFIFEINKAVTRDRGHQTGDMRHETWDMRQQTWDRRQRGLSLHAN